MNAKLPFYQESRRWIARSLKRTTKDLPYEIARNTSVECKSDEDRVLENNIDNAKTLKVTPLSKNSDQIFIGPIMEITNPKLLRKLQLNEDKFSGVINALRKMKVFLDDILEITEANNSPVRLRQPQPSDSDTIESNDLSEELAEKTSGKD